VVDAKTDDNKTAIALKGHGLPKSFVTLFIYSEMPIVLTVETDDNGNWSYMLDNNIDNGVHQAYVAVTDNTGKITAKSQPLFFVKTAEAVNVIPPTEASGTAVSSPASTRQTPYMLASLIIAAITLLLALIVIGKRMSRANIKNNSDQL
jgi:hypothetical protein